MIQLHRLEGFFRVAVAGGYTRAARDFPYPISQPGVHQQVSKLEAELGKKLFDRQGRDHVELTAAGRRLFEFAKPFFEGLPLVAREISAGSFGGLLRIDAAALEIRYLMPRWIQQLRRARPDIDVDLEEGAKGSRISRAWPTERTDSGGGLPAAAARRNGSAARGHSLRVRRGAPNKASNSAVARRVCVPFVTNRS
ncbi:MAG: LysR family transcriptional regulator [Pseudomonadota bacterium]